ncbi:MAG: polysaccharide biosynthesis protein, partial [Lachnospiraceae bacterium]|nr:polysaccharide biosynthesis protein [Lachnospiraceae bacterium]
GIWLNESWELGQIVLTLILIDFYFKGGRVVLVNFKIAAGVFEQDKYLSLIQGAVNLVLSIIGIKYIGLAGVYVGTVVSGVMANLIQPGIIYRNCFDKNTWSYFKDSVKYIGVIAGVVLLMIPVKALVMAQVSIVTFIVMAAVITIAYNLIFFLFFGRTREFAYLWNLITGRVPLLKKFSRKG